MGCSMHTLLPHIVFVNSALRVSFLPSRCWWTDWAFCSVLWLFKWWITDKMNKRKETPNCSSEQQVEGGSRFQKHVWLQTLIGFLVKYYSSVVQEGVILQINVIPNTCGCFLYSIIQVRFSSNTSHNTLWNDPAVHTVAGLPVCATTTLQVVASTECTALCPRQCWKLRPVSLWVDYTMATLLSSTHLNVYRWFAQKALTVGQPVSSQSWQYHWD